MFLVTDQNIPDILTGCGEFEYVLGKSIFITEKGVIYSKVVVEHKPTKTLYFYTEKLDEHLNVVDTFFGETEDDVLYLELYEGF